MPFTMLLCTAAASLEQTRACMSVSDLLWERRNWLLGAGEHPPPPSRAPPGRSIGIPKQQRGNFFGLDPNYCGCLWLSCVPWPTFSPRIRWLHQAHVR